VKALLLEPYMSNIVFTPEHQPQNIADDIKRVFDAILSAYSPEGTHYSSHFASVYPFPNKHIAIEIKPNKDNSGAIVKIPFDHERLPFNDCEKTSYEIAFEFAARDENQRKASIAKYIAKTKETFGDNAELLPSRKDAFGCRVNIAFPIIPESESAMSNINTALQKSGLRPRPDALKGKVNEYIVVVTNDNCDQEWFRVETDLDFYQMEHDDVVSALQNKISIDPDSEDVCFTDNLMQRITLDK
tara:strand:+ start:5232 stop:5963 length:732 start_codon:yes stop_codon:yes gene_type:complete